MSINRQESEECLMQHLFIGKILYFPSSCLKAIRHLQVTGHIPAESAFFRKYSQYGLFEDIRLVALEILVDFVHGNVMCIIFDCVLFSFYF